MEGKIDLKCIFCKELCITDFSRLREQGANTINHANQIRQDIIVANPGDYVHKQYCLDYVRRPVFIRNVNSSSKPLRSSSGDFKYHIRLYQVLYIIYFISEFKRESNKNEQDELLQ